MYSRLLIVFVLISVYPLSATADEPGTKKKPVAHRDKALQQLDWLIGEWEHTNPSSYNAVENLVFKWGDDGQSIEANYRYISYPGFCETTYFRCTEKICVTPDGELRTEFDYHPLRGFWQGDVRGERRLTSNKEGRWEGSTLSGKPKEKTTIVFKKTSDTSFEITTSPGNDLGNDSEYEFRKKPKAR